MKELIEQGMYQIPRSPDDGYTYIAYEKFVQDPEANPLMKTGFGQVSRSHCTLSNTVWERRR